jgi:hypothetical protein
MPTALGNNKQTNQVRQQLGWLGLAALATVLVLATACRRGILRFCHVNGSLSGA